MSSKTSFQPKNPIIPISFGIRHNPPTLALVYKRIASDIKERIYYILLNNLINISNAKLVSQKLFEEHPLFLNDSSIEFSQVEKLVSVLLRHHEENRERENYHTPFPDMMSPIQTLNSAKNPYNIQDSTKDLTFPPEKNQSLRGILDRMASTHSFDEENNTPYKENSRQFENMQYPSNNNNNNNNQQAKGMMMQQQQNNNTKKGQNKVQNDHYQPQNNNQYMNIEDVSQQAQIISQNEAKNQRGRNKNEKNRGNITQPTQDQFDHEQQQQQIITTDGEILEVQNNQQSDQQQNYYNSHYNYGQRHAGDSGQSPLNVQDEMYGENEFVDCDNEGGYNADYHNVMEEEPNLLNNLKQNPFKHIQIPQGVHNGPTSSTFMSTPMKGYMDSQMNFNTPGQPVAGGMKYNSYNNLEEINSDYAKPEMNYRNSQKQIQNQFQKRQSLALQESEPVKERGEKKLRGKFGILQDLASLHKDHNAYEDNQLEVI